MPPRRSSLPRRFSAGPLLVLSSGCLWGCPQLRSDEFIELGVADPTGQGPSDLGDGGGGGGTGGSAGGEGTEPPAPQNGGAGGVGGAPVAEPGAPSVVSVSPSDGATGVPADAALSVMFSESMNTRAVEAAYGSSELPAGAVTFSWSAADTLLQITPKQPLTLATGSAPTTTVAQRYAFEIGTAAVDLDGEALPRFSTSFSTLREINQTLTALQDRSLTGNYRSDDVYGNNSCQELDSTTTCIGDSSNGNSTYRGFVSFDLSVLPVEAQEISAARLSLAIDTIRGTPFAALGNLVAEHVSFDTIDLEAFQAPALAAPITVSSSAAAGAQLSIDVLAPAASDWSSRGRSQFRYRFVTDTDSNDAGDLIETLSTSEQLAIGYLIP
jgi:Big-like domain-containing protein